MYTTVLQYSILLYTTLQYSKLTTVLEYKVQHDYK